MSTGKVDFPCEIRSHSPVRVSRSVPGRWDSGVSPSPPAQRVRSASLLVLCGWAAFMVAGSVFAKFSEHWIGPTPLAHRAVPSVGYSVVQWAGTTGGLVVLVGLVLALPAFVRHIRGGGWATVRLPIVRAAVAGLSMIGLTTALALWAHHLSGPARNGGSGAYGVAFVLWATSCVAAFAVVTWAGVSVAAQLPFTARVDQALGLLAVVVTIDMAVVVAGLLVWWVSLAEQAPRALDSGLLATGNVVPPVLVGSGLLMVGALAAAVVASCRAVASLRSVGTGME